MMENMKEDRINFLEDFGKQFFGVGMLNKPVSTPYLQYFHSLAGVALPRATQQCALSFVNTDFRADIASINLPTLIIHGDADKTVPMKASSDRTAKMIPNAIYKVYEGCATRPVYY
jgi:pimeloyl-ACP methyl ester carboxylesterase